MNNNPTIKDFIGQAAYSLTGDIPGSLVVRGDSCYENIDWNTDLITTPLPTKEQVLAKAQEFLDGEADKRLRVHRDLLLKECDWTQGADSPLSDEKKAEWATYRQALRDLPSNASPVIDGPFVKNVTWPTKP